MEKISRLRKKVIMKKFNKMKKKAEWTQLDLQDPNLMQYITDSMTYGLPMQIDYENSGWRTIYPYGFNTSQDGNVSIMCYKDSGEVRSYRIDKIYDMYIDYDGFEMQNNDQMNEDIDIQYTEDIFNQQNDVMEDFPVIEDNDINNEDNETGVYDDVLQLFEDEDEIEPVEEGDQENEQGYI